MQQNLQYSYSSDPRSGGNQNQQLHGISFQQNSYQPTSYSNSNSNTFHSSSSAAFIPNTVTQAPQHRRGEEKNLVNMLDAYFIDSTTPSTSSSWNNQQPVQMSSIQQSVSTYNQQIPLPKDVDLRDDSMSMKMGGSPDKSEKDRVKKARQAEAARMRYHRLSNEEKRELNLKRTLAQKRKRQREKEMEELESILRETNDIQEDPDITEQLREKRMRAKWAEAARTRYARMTPEERRAHNTRRRMRQMQNAMSAIKACGMATGDPQKDDEAVRQHIKNQNAKKAEAARQRYHRMNDDEKRVYNQRRTEAFRRRRMEEEMLLAMPIGRINGEALDRAQQIVVRNAKRAEAARLRYQRMTPDQRKIAKQEPKDESWPSHESDTHDHDLGDSYNQKRYTPKRRRNEIDDMMAAGQMAVGSSGTIAMGTGTPSKKDDMDALSTLERDVVKRTQHAQQILLRQRANQASTPRSDTPPPQQAYIVNSNGQPQHQQLVSNNGHQQILHGGHMQQQQQIQQSSQSIPPNIYTSGMLIQNQGQQGQSQQQQQQNQQILNNPYRN